MPAAVIGASIGAVGPQFLRAVLSFCNARQMTAPEAYMHFTPGRFAHDGKVADSSTAIFLGEFMEEFRAHIERVLIVIPRRDPSTAGGIQRPRAAARADRTEVGPLRCRGGRSGPF
jgi:hypothetical protein